MHIFGPMAMSLKSINCKRYKILTGRSFCHMMLRDSSSLRTLFYSEEDFPSEEEFTPVGESTNVEI